MQVRQSCMQIIPKCGPSMQPCRGREYLPRRLLVAVFPDHSMHAVASSSTPDAPPGGPLTAPNSLSLARDGVKRSQRPQCAHGPDARQAAVLADGQVAQVAGGGGQKVNPVPAAFEVRVRAKAKVVTDALDDDFNLRVGDG